MCHTIVHCCLFEQVHRTRRVACWSKSSSPSPHLCTIRSRVGMKNTLTVNTSVQYSKHPGSHGMSLVGVVLRTTSQQRLAPHGSRCHFSMRWQKFSYSSLSFTRAHALGKAKHVISFSATAATFQVILQKCSLVSRQYAMTQLYKRVVICHFL